MSWFFTLIEISVRDLPWFGINNPDEMAARKVKSCTAGKLCQDLPREYRDIFEYIKRLDYEMEPDYDFLHRLLDEASSKVKVRPQWEWFKVKTKYLKRISAIDVREEGIVLFDAKRPIRHPNMHVCEVQ